MRLVIVESPKKCETIAHYLGSDYKVMASQGHIRDLSTKGKGGLGIDVEHGFAPDFVISPNKKAIVKELQSTAAKADEVILATDPDREGEAISWHLAQVLGLDVATTKRLQFHEITQPAIEEAIEHPSHIDMNLVNSQETRRMYDRIIGFKLSSLLQKKMSSKSAGRVQSVTLKMIVDNDDEIKKFVPVEYWSIEATVIVDGKPLVLSLDKVDGKNVEIHNQEEAEAIMKRIGESMALSSLVSVKKNISSKLPFTTSTMQQEAYNRFKFSTSKTQSIAQRLYEGETINGEHVGLITYMRTDSTRISEDFYFRHAKPFILEKFGQEYLGHVKANKSKERIQDAHEAIRPTGTHRTPEMVAQYLEPDEAKLYRLIYDRALASLMSDKLEEQTSASFTTNGLSFKATGARILFKGYEAIYGEFDDDDTKLLPELKQGADYALQDKKDEQKFTKAPARYTEAKVVKLMEEKGIGRPSTYASTIKTLISRGYIVSKGGVLTPTENGIRTTFVLNKYFPEILSTEYTANMENELDKIEEGKDTKLDAMNEFYEPFMSKYTKVAELMYKDPAQETGEKCPVCGSPLVIKKSRYGSFVACSNYPKCKYIKKEPKPEPKYTGEMCPECGKPLVERVDRKGQTFVACSGYPACHYIKGAENKESTKKVYTEADWVKPCPKCKTGHLVVKKGRKVSFLGCTNFPKCHYHEWLSDKKTSGK
ncbi:MAG: type I DNA topoisomerase [Bacilli bacterium]|jgi:DNA topoisomerase-1|nr:type I DNA topoisomerase [Bacilli bacterium]MCH4210462.1 type I DNA topoisomerase [Bacilli bacterium]MCH4228363.1 type I DNA topoisomerase [Bacilli bacterium]MCH4277635.1 type I DNA topoisomerase [Bacilli bacterium]MCI2054821.1 type I DNA topoisomerase [Bacilli bacterium]